MTFTDEDLTAYLDGEVTDQTRRDIKQALESDANLAARLRDLDIPLAPISQAFAPDRLGAPDLPPELLTAPQQGRTSWGLIAACAAGAFVLGSLSTSLFSAPDQNPSWITAIAAYQVLYVDETLAVPQQDPALTASTLKSAHSAFGLDLAAALDLPGLTFKRAQMLGFDGEPLLQMAYVDQNGVPVALCLTRVSEANQSMRDVTSHALSGTAWSENGVGFLLIGDTAATQDPAIKMALSTKI